MLEQPQPANLADEVPGFAAVVVQVAAGVLETMFFEEAVASVCEHSWLPTAISAHLTFDGSHCGEFVLSVSPDTARSIAAGFLGLDPEEMTAAQPGDVLLELSNIICGALMSTLWPESSLSLGTPDLTGAEHSFPDAMHCCFTLPDGMVAVSLGLSDAQVSA
jgi:CheY-specific phosphatase CheX